jgi:fumarate reductase subunit C
VPDKTRESSALTTTHAGRLAVNASVPVRSSRWPARLDVAQSVSGLLLALFMWGHMVFVSSILVSKDAMWTITKLFEGYFFFGRSYPWIVSVIIGAVFALFIAHAGLALRKFPANYRQYALFRHHMQGMRHEDTTLWYWQVITGFALFFLASAHLWWMITHPGNIGPYASSDRVWGDHFWVLYLVLLFAVEIHGGVGLYRLAVKWGVFEGRDPAASRRRLRRVKWTITVFLIALGLATLAAYVRIGMAHEAQRGERYTPAWVGHQEEHAP